MTLSTEMKKLRESKAFYAVAGAGDLAAEKLREVPGQWRKIEGLKGARRELSGRAQSYAVVLTGKAVEVYGDLGSRAVETYEGLAERGRHVVLHTGEAAREAAGEIESQAAATGRSAQQTAASARKTAQTSRKATTDAASKASNKSAAGKTDTDADTHTAK